MALVALDPTSQAEAQPDEPSILHFRQEEGN
jgi:hypothetical protein